MDDTLRGTIRGSCKFFDRMASWFCCRAGLKVELEMGGTLRGTMRGSPEFGASPEFSFDAVDGEEFGGGKLTSCEPPDSLAEVAFSPEDTLNGRT